MPAGARVGCRDERRPGLPLRRQDADDGLRRQLGAVGEDDHGRLRLGREGGQPAAERRARPELPVGAGDHARAVHLQRIRPGHDDDVADGRLREPREHTR